MKQPSIPSFVLYGEKLDDDVAEFAHIETIAARSALYDWEIAPHRHLRSVQALLLFNGQVKFRCDGLMQDLRAPCHMIVPIGSVHGFQFSPETAGYVLTLSGGFTSRAIGANDPLLHLLTRGASGTIVEPNLSRVSWLCREMLKCQADWQAPQPLFMALAEALVRSLPSSMKEAAADEQRLVEFRRLIEFHLREHRSVAWYAGKLAVTSKTLTRICRRSVDCTPTELIHARLVLEARRLLGFTNATVSQVANDLGFSDASYFSRFYCRLTGGRPRVEKHHVRDSRAGAGDRLTAA